MVSRAQRYRAKKATVKAAMTEQAIAQNLQGQIGKIDAIESFINKMAAQAKESKYPGNAADLTKAAKLLGQASMIIEEVYRDLGDQGLSLSNKDAALTLKKAAASLRAVVPSLKTAMNQMSTGGAGSDISDWIAQLTKLASNVDAGGFEVAQIDEDE